MKFMKFFPIIFGIVLFASCSDYNQVLKGDDYQAKFQMADSLYSNQYYLRSVGLYEQIYQRFPKQGEGELAYFRIGKSYFLAEDYIMAGYFLGEFPNRYPFSPKVEEATFLTALCSVKNSPEPSLDPTETEIAINSLQQFVERFPESILVDSCNNEIDRLRFKLEVKDFEAVRLYSKTLNYRAAVTSGEIFIKNYPMSQFREEAGYILVENSYLLTKSSIDEKKLERTEQTLERYRNFVAEFPESSYLKSLGHVIDEMELELAKLLDEEEKSKKK